MAYAATVNGVLPPWNINTEGLLAHYYASGDPAVRTMIGKMADAMADQTRDGFNEYGPSGSGWRLGGVAKLLPTKPMWG